MTVISRELVKTEKIVLMNMKKEIMLYPARGNIVGVTVTTMTIEVGSMSEVVLLLSMAPKMHTLHVA